MTKRIPETIPQMEYISVLDTTLRDGAQSPGISLSTEESVDIARQLSRLGVDIIEAGFPISSRGNFEAVQTIAQEVEGPIIAGLARTHRADIDKAAEAIRDSERPRIHTFISTSDIHIEHQLKTNRDDVRGQTRAGVAHAKSYVDDVEFSPMDATRADIEFTAEICQIAIDEGATTINIPDTVGYTQPDEYKAYLRRLYDLVPGLGSVVLSVHCHNDLGLAVANSFAGVQAGARQIECAINGLGERAGNAALEEITMLFRTRRLTDGFDTRINTPLLGATSRLVSRYAGYDLQKNKAIVGYNAFRHESGIHQDGVIKERSTFEIMNPEDVGMDPNTIVLGKQSGRHAMRDVLEREGVFMPDHMATTFALFKEIADKIGAVSQDQITEIQDEARRRDINPLKLNDYQVSSSGQRIYSAMAAVTYPDGRTEVGTAHNYSDDHIGGVDGPTSALYMALDEATGSEYELESHQVRSIGTDKGTIGKGIVTLRVNDKAFTGYGLSLDTNEASARAYLDAIRQVEAEALSQLSAG